MECPVAGSCIRAEALASSLARNVKFRQEAKKPGSEWSGVKSSGCVCEPRQVSVRASIEAGAFTCASSTRKPMLVAKDGEARP